MCYPVLRSLAALVAVLGLTLAAGIGATGAPPVAGVPRRQPDGLREYQAWLRSRAGSGYPTRYVPLAATIAAARQWEPLGPRRVESKQQARYGNGFVAGRVNAVAYHPQQPQVYYAGAATGGFWRTDDRGANWRCLSDRWPNGSISSIAVDPADGGTVYVGTGDFPMSSGELGFGVMKTTDRGETWQQLGEREFAGHNIRALLVDPENRNLVIAATGRSAKSRGYVWRSTNGGVDWVRVLPRLADWSDLACSHGGTPHRYYAVGHGYHGGELWVSTDRGAGWSKLEPPLTNDYATNGWQEGLDLAVSPQFPEVLYLLSGTDRRIWKSPDAGKNWKDVTANLPGGADNWSNSWYDFFLACGSLRTTGQDVVYAGLIDLAASLDGGRNWQSVGRVEDDDALVHQDQHCLAVNPNDPQEVLVGNDGGVYRLVYKSKKASWSCVSLNATLEIAQVYQAASHPTKPDQFLAGVQDNGVVEAPGSTAKWQRKGTGDGGPCAIHATYPETQYYTTNGPALFATQDSWMTPVRIGDEAWETVHRDGVPDSPLFGADVRGLHLPIALAAGDADVLYAGTNYLWRYNHSRRSWTRRLGGQQLAAGSGFLTALAVAPGDSNRLYAGGSGGDLWTSADGGGTWKDLDPDRKTLPRQAVTCIAVHPARPHAILVGYGGEAAVHVWACTDAAATRPNWVPAHGVRAPFLPPVPVHSVAFDPCAPRQLYAGTEIGFFQSEDGGGTWRNGGAPYGLPNVRVNHVQVVEKQGFVVVATWGRGIWKRTIPAAGPAAR